MANETRTPGTKAHEQRRLEFARAWTARKRQDQEEIVEEAKTDPKIIAAFAELDRRANERGTRIIEL